ncbi:glycoside hydrolase (plasmid) [Streptomyces alboflavus]|uniref:Glycoside hydrolase n=1 Tax=Streptomyces alboflavus TaxID=67267 RepID=A0A291W379_9ACTN|nr:bifunctional lytic transglycosylase/C40 family peptidase [Streptomyces alboflavus]ATM24750.1 glycoside hydrolase [Streptomyces alboflavus]
MKKFLKILVGLGVAWLCVCGILIAAVMAVVTKLGSDNTGNDIQDAGFGGGISKNADVPDWLRELISKAINDYGCPEVTPALLAAQLYQESGFNPKIQSFREVEKDGKVVKVPLASGISQFIPGTWATHGKDGDGDGDKDVFDPVDAVPAAVDYDCFIAKEVRKVPGDKADNMLAAYNAGPYPVQKYGGIPPYPETQNYVKIIRRLAEKWTDEMQEGTPVSAPSGRAGQVVAAARTALGTDYQWGGTCRRPFSLQGGNGCDCSSLMKMAWASVGVNLPRTTYDQVKKGSVVRSTADLEPGDLLFSRGSASTPEHVAMYIGNGEVIDAPKTGLQVRIKPLSYWKSQILVMKRVG